MKLKFAAKIIAAALAIATLGVELSGCDVPSADEINNAVAFPKAYCIEYQVRDKDGVIRIVSKTKDECGNIHFRSGDSETMFIKDGTCFVEYVKNGDGTFSCEEGKKVDEHYVDNATAEFDEYAEQAKMKYLPGIESQGEQELLGRTCFVYQVKVGLDSHHISFAYYVDKETGICLGFDSNMELANISVGTDDTVFTCTRFATDGIEDLSVMLNNN